MRRFLVLFCALSCHAATVVTNLNLDGQRWTSNGSPYIVNGDLFLYGFDSFRIGPGVEVLIADQDETASGGDTNRVEIGMDGPVFFESTTEQPIIFRAQTNAAPGSWYGLRVPGGVATSFYASNVFIFHAVIGIHFSRARPNYTEVRDFTVATNEVGIRVDRGFAFIRQLHAFQNSTGAVLFSSLVENSIIRDNYYDGILLPRSLEDSRSHINFNTIARNGGAGIRIIRSDYNLPQPQILGCLIVSNLFGLAASPHPTNFVLPHFSNFFGNSSADFANALPGEGCISAEPRLRPDFSLRRDSPCIDAGIGGFPRTDIVGNPRGVDDPNTPNTGVVDSEGLINDIGAFEFQPLRISGWQRTEEEVVLRFYTQPDEIYQVQSSPDLNNWQTVSGETIGSGREVEAMVTSSTTDAFYRIVGHPQ